MGAGAATPPGHPPAHPALTGPRTAPLPFNASVTSPVERTSVSSAPVCDGGFHPVVTPAIQYQLTASAAVGPNDVWAVGFSFASPQRTLAEHWDGASWSIVPTPNPSSFSSDLNGVTAISTNDVWSVGAYQVDAAGHVNTFAEHWNGSSWALYTSTPNPTPQSYLYGVNAVSSSSVWAVGTYNSAGNFTLVEHWNGSSWSVVPSPSPTASNGSFLGNQLYSASAFSASDVWAVGSTGTRSNIGNSVTSLAEHWNGTTWSVVTTPNLSGWNEIFYVTALDAGRAVGVGFGRQVYGTIAAQSEAWDLLAAGGSANSVLPGVGAGDNYMTGVDRSGAAVWAVGFWSTTLPGNASLQQFTLAISATWNSTTQTLTWASFPGTSENPGTASDWFFAVTAISPYAFWAVGALASATAVSTLAEAYCPLHFSVTGPAGTTAGTAFGITVTVKNGSGATATGYLGRVHFTSSDPSATLPGDYSFTPSDQGAHAFLGLALRTGCLQTITVADLVMPLTLPGSATVKLTSVCPAPAGTPGTRGTSPAPAGTPGNRNVNQSPSGPPAPRFPRLAAGVGGDPVGTHGVVRAAVSAPTALRLSSSAPAAARADPAGGAASTTAKEPPPAETVSALRRSDVVPARPAGTPSWLVLLVSLVVSAVGLTGLASCRLKDDA
jgi:hypothetical protein